MFFFRVDWHLDTYFLQIWVVSSLGYFSWILWGSGTYNIYRLKQVIQVYQQQENYTIKFLPCNHETAPAPFTSGHTPGDLQFFSFLEVYFPSRAHRKRQFPTPECLINLIHFLLPFLICTKAKWLVFTAFMNVILSLLRER